MSLLGSKKVEAVPAPPEEDTTEQIKERKKNERESRIRAISRTRNKGIEQLKADGTGLNL